MKPTDATKRFLRVPTNDGSSAHVPVSEFILNLNKHPAPTLSSVRRSPLMQHGAALVLTLLLCASSFGMTYANPIGTLSYFRDSEVSRTNVFAAGQLGFRLNPGDVTLPIAQGETVTLSPLFAPLPETLDINYRVRAEVVGQESPLCMLLRAAGTSSPYVYDGSLKDLVSEVSTTTGHGHLVVTLPEAAGIANGTECTVALVYKAWAKGAQENTGYTDEHRDTFTFVYSAPAETQSVPEEAKTGAPPVTESVITETSDESTTSPETPPVPTETTPAPEAAPEEAIPAETPPSEPPADTTPAPEAAQPAPTEVPAE